MVLLLADASREWIKILVVTHIAIFELVLVKKAL